MTPAGHMVASNRFKDCRKGFVADTEREMRRTKGRERKERGREREKGRVGRETEEKTGR